MEWVTTTAKTLPEAIDLALDNLGVDESEAEIVVLEEPSKGLFGRVRGTARVEARVKPKAIRPKAERGRNRKGRGNDRKRSDRSGRRNRSNERSDRNDRGGRSSNNGGKRSNGNKGAGNKNEGRRGQSKHSQDSHRSSTKVEANATDEKPSASTGAAAGAAASSDNGGQTRRRRRRSKGSSGNRGNSTANSSTADNSTVNNSEETPVEEVAEHLRSFLGGLTEAFGLEGGVDIDTSETDVMVATVQGQHGLMVGPKGRTLDAIQELARVSSQRAAPSNIRIRIDVGGYRKQRAAALGDFARKAADKAVDNASEVALEPMSPADRKSIHDALVDDNRVETRSVGTEPRRKVIVIPLEAPAAAGEAEGEEE